jgi:hypothetical protein
VVSSVLARITAFATRHTNGVITERDDNRIGLGRACLRAHTLTFNQTKAFEALSAYIGVLRVAELAVADAHFTGAVLDEVCIVLVLHLGERLGISRS